MRPPYSDISQQANPAILSQPGQTVPNTSVDTKTPPRWSRTNTLSRIPWRLVVLIALPLTVASLSVLLVGPRFSGHITFTLPMPSHPMPSQTFSKGQTASLGWETYRHELLRFAWQTIPHTDEASYAWSVSASPDERQLHLAVDGTSLADLESHLSNLGRGYLKHLKASGERQNQRATALSLPLENYREALIANLESLPHPTTLASSQNENQNKNQNENPPHDPLETLIATTEQSGQQRETYRQIRAELDNAQAEKTRLQQAPTPTTALIDSTTRQQAYLANTVLQQDLRHLEVQLALVRAAMLEIWQEASASLDEALLSAKRLAELADAPELASLSSAHRALLERVAEGGADLHMRTTRFAQDWTQAFLALQATHPNPNHAAILQSYEHITQQLSDHARDASRLLATTRQRIRGFTEQSNEKTQTHVLTSELIRVFHEVRSDYQHFTAISSDLQAPDNYLLNAALESARALNFRASSIHRAIDTQLEKQAKHDAMEERREKIDALSARIEQLRRAQDQQVEEVLTTLRTLNIAAVKIPDFVKKNAVRDLANTRREWLENQLAWSDEAAKKLQSTLPDPVSPAAIKVSPPIIEHFPTNLATLLTVGVLAWGATLLALAATWRPHPHPHPKTNTHK